MEILEALGIRPTQLAVQIVGFLILFLGLAKFLWKPILGMMEQREQEVRDIYGNAEKAESEAEELKAKYETKVVNIEEEAQAKIADAVHRGNTMAEEIVSGARKEAEMEKQKAMNAIREEASQARRSLRDYVVGLSFDLAGKVLESEVSKDSHENLVKTFLNDLENMETGKA
jgi:F-type H+-transporting ATPase subunit b